MTLVEVLVSLVIISMLLLVIYHLLRQARLEIPALGISNGWKQEA